MLGRALYIFARFVINEERLAAGLANYLVTIFIGSVRCRPGFPVEVSIKFFSYSRHVDVLPLHFSSWIRGVRSAQFSTDSVLPQRFVVRSIQIPLEPIRR